MTKMGKITIIIFNNLQGKGDEEESKAFTAGNREYSSWLEASNAGISV